MIATYLAAHPDRCPVNGQQLAVATSACAGVAYVVVSKLTYKKPFNLDEMLHRGAYRPAEEPANADAPVRERFWLARFLDVNDRFTRGDRPLTFGTFFWSTLWQSVAIGVLLWTVFVGRLPATWWFGYQMYVVTGIALALAVPTTVWFTIGVTRDLIELIRALRLAKPNDVDDGTAPVGASTAAPPALTADTPTTNATTTSFGMFMLILTLMLTTSAALCVRGR